MYFWSVNKKHSAENLWSSPVFSVICSIPHDVNPAVTADEAITLLFIYQQTYIYFLLWSQITWNYKSHYNRIH